MDFTCNFRQPNAFPVGEILSSRTLGCLNPRLRFRCRSFSYSYTGYPRLVSKGCASKKTKKIVSGSIASCQRRTGEFDRFLWASPLKGCLDGNLGHILKVSREIARLQCQGNDSLNTEFLDSTNGDMKSLSPESLEKGPVSDAEPSSPAGEGVEIPSVDDLREVLQKALRELEVAQLNSTIEEDVARESVQKATMALSMAEARLQLAVKSPEIGQGMDDSPEIYTESDADNVKTAETSSSLVEEKVALLVSQDEIRDCQATLENCEAELRCLQNRKEELQKEVERLNEVAEKVQMDALKAEEDVADIMLLAASCCF
uniref:Uncharacterized protein n=1 Tax=Nelumbo nucifera TaxID=4432 RepID=A0A822XG18_NELNU|nr:TPA_asm: hypothetical protein HUJ06_020315 [Nelumbo nucifera]